MIRPLTLICLLSAIGSGLYLYSEKHRATLTDRDIARLIHGTEAARERTAMLRAEWALLNDPGRLQDMADRYLQLKPMAPGQFVQLSELSTRLPPPVPPGQSGGTDDDDTAAGAPVADATAPPSGAVPVQPAHAPDGPAAPSVLAHAAPAEGGRSVVARAEPVKPAPHAAPKMLARAAPAHRAAHPVSVADREPPVHNTPLARGTMLPLAGMPQMGARVMSAMARPMRQPVSPRPVVVSAYPAAIAPAPYVGSALASAGRLPPPVPLSGDAP